MNGCKSSNSRKTEKTSKVSTSEQEQWKIISKAYTYTFPLVIMNLTMTVSTNVKKADLAGHAPVNQLIHLQKLATSDSKLVVTPNVDTVYSQAWLNIEKEPMVYVKPKTD